MENQENELKRVINEISKMENKFNDLRDKTKAKLDKAVNETDRKYIMNEFEKKVTNLKNDEVFVKKIKELKKQKKKLEEEIKTNKNKKIIPKNPGSDSKKNIQQTKPKIIRKQKIVTKELDNNSEQPTIFENLNTYKKTEKTNSKDNLKSDRNGNFNKIPEDIDNDISSLMNKYKNIKVEQIPDRVEIKNYEKNQKKSENYFQEEKNIEFDKSLFEKKPKKNINEILKQINEDINNFK